MQVNPPSLNSVNIIKMHQCAMFSRSSFYYTKKLIYKSVLLVILLKGATALTTAPGSDFHRGDSVPVATESWTLMSSRNKKNPSGETQQIIKITSKAKDDFYKTAQVQQFSTAANNKLFGSGHENSSVVVLTVLITLSVGLIFTIIKCCCCRYRNTLQLREMGMRRTPTYEDTSIQLIEEINCTHRD